MKRVELPILGPCPRVEDAIRVAPDLLWCESCRKHIHDVSAMTEPDARRFLAGLGERSACARYRVDAAATIQFAELYQSVSQELGCGFFDAATVAKSTAEEDVHLDAANTRAIGMGLVPLVKELLDIG